VRVNVRVIGTVTVRAMMLLMMGDGGCVGEEGSVVWCVCACAYYGESDRYCEGAGYDEAHGGARVHVRVRVMVAVRVHDRVM
jgi:hypothetical protein